MIRHAGGLLLQLSSTILARPFTSSMAPQLWPPFASFGHWNGTTYEKRGKMKSRGNVPGKLIPSRKLLSSLLQPRTTTYFCSCFALLLPVGLFLLISTLTRTHGRFDTSYVSAVKDRHPVTMEASSPPKDSKMGAVNNSSCWQYSASPSGRTCCHLLADGSRGRNRGTVPMVVAAPNSGSPA